MKWVVSAETDRYGSQWSTNCAFTVACSPVLRSMITLNASLNAFANRSIDKMTKELRAVLRAPWDIFHFNLVDASGTENVLTAEGAPITEQHLKQWLVQYHPELVCEGELLKPSEFLTACPTWGGDDGKAYPTDVFTALFGVDPTSAPVSDTGALDFAKAIVLDVTPSFVFSGAQTSGLDPVLVMPAGQETRGGNPWMTRTNAAYMGGEDPNAPGWESTFRFAVWSEMDNFELQTARMAEALVTMAHLGLMVPFNFALLPEELKGYSRVALSVNFSLNMCSLVRNDSKTIRAPFDIDAGLMAHRITYPHLNFDAYTGNAFSTLANSCLTPDVRPAGGSKNGVPRTIKEMAAVVETIIRTVNVAWHAKHKKGDHDEIEQALDALLVKAGRARTLLETQNNLHFDQSEGFLQLLECKTQIDFLLSQCNVRGLITQDQFKEWSATLQRIDPDTLLVDATNAGIYKKEYAKARRPMNVYAAKAIRDQLAQTDRIIRLQTRTDTPAWVEGLTVGMAALAITAVIVTGVVLTQRILRRN